MKAGYLIAPTQIEVREIALPVPDPGGVVVRVKVALTDGTDLKAFRRGHPQMPMPTRFGHEFSGDVVAIGTDVRSFSVGDAIMCVHSAPDGTCYWCVRGEEELCERVMETKILGAYAEYIAVPAHIIAQNAYRKPSDLSYEAAAFLEPLACVVHAQRQLAAKPGDTVAIVGTGGFGILHALVVRALGGTPILIGRHPERLAFAERLGITATIDSRARDAATAVLERTLGRGADAVIESTGARDVWELAPSLVRRGGTVVLFGGLPGGTRVTYDAARLHYDELKLLSPFHFTPRAVRHAYDLLASHEVDVEPLISERYALDDLAAAFGKLAEGSGLKFALLP